MHVNTPPPSGDGPELLDAVGADADVPVVEVDGRVAMAGDEADLLRPASTIARSSVGRLITVAQTKRFARTLWSGRRRGRDCGRNGVHEIVGGRIAIRYRRRSPFRTRRVRVLASVTFGRSMPLAREILRSCGRLLVLF
jgi:hypothetical protein